MEEESAAAECSFCNSEIKSDDDFCPSCGSLFVNAGCVNHPGKEADGVCVICTDPFCNQCGLFVNDILFLCNKHSEYETIEGMANVFSSPDEINVNLVKSTLEQEGLHPILFSKNSGYGEPRIMEIIYGTMGNYLKDGDKEIKVMIPFQEVIKAEELLKQLQIIE